MHTPQNVIIIPARYASSRFPGKALAPLRGPGGQSRSLIEWCWRAARAVPGVDAIWIATDDDRIAMAAQGFGAQVVMTAEACENGTERCADALARLGIVPRTVINLQGDAPLTPPWFVSALMDRMARGAQVATPVLPLSHAQAERLRADRHAGIVGGTTAVTDAQGRALYFSKEVLPHGAQAGRMEVLLHVGVYAYTPAALAAYVGSGPCNTERAEGLEQLRFLHHGIPVDCVTVDARGRSFHEVNNPGDIATVEAGLRALELA